MLLIFLVHHLSLFLSRAQRFNLSAKLSHEVEMSEKRLPARHHGRVCLFFGARLCSLCHCCFNRTDRAIERVRIRRLFGLVRHDIYIHVYS